MGPGPLHRFKVKIKRALGMKIFLCDSCKWDWRSTCHNPERPNATWCPDYERRGKESPAVGQPLNQVIGQPFTGHPPLGLLDIIGNSIVG